MIKNHHSVPFYVSTLFKQAVFCFQNSRPDEAETIINRILSRAPGYADAEHLLGLIASQRGQYDVAIRSIKSAISRSPSEPTYCNNLCLVLHMAGRNDEALKACERAIQLKPTYAEAYNIGGAILMELGRFDEALTACERAIQLKPAYAEAHNTRGAVLGELGRLEEAVESYNLAININPVYVQAHSNRGAALCDLGQLEEALAAHQMAISLNPDIAQSHNNHANVLCELGLFEEARAAYKKAIQLNPQYVEAHNNYAMLLLLEGDFKDGWREYEWRWKNNDLPSTLRDSLSPQWGGEKLQGKTIFLYGEQGYGDTLQFIRYIPYVAQSGGRIVLECQKELINLLLKFPGIDLLVEQGDSIPDFDVHAPLMSLPYILGTTLETIPCEIPYLIAPGLPYQKRAQIGLEEGKKNIGIVWAGRVTHKNDRNRSIDPALFHSLLDIPDTNWLSLQIGERATELGNNKGLDKVIDTSPYIADFSDTASIINHLDLVISVDTSVVHLAGALGKPVWVLLPFRPDWRWLLDRNDSPWYPGLRIFRQTDRGDWLGVFNQVRKALER